MSVRHRRTGTRRSSKYDIRGSGSSSKAHQPCAARVRDLYWEPSSQRMDASGLRECAPLLRGCLRIDALLDPTPQELPEKFHPCRTRRPSSERPGRPFAGSVCGALTGHERRTPHLQEPGRICTSGPSSHEGDHLAGTCHPPVKSVTKRVQFGNRNHHAPPTRRRLDFRLPTRGEAETHFYAPRQRGAMIGDVPST